MGDEAAYWEAVAERAKAEEPNHLPPERPKPDSREPVFLIPRDLDLIPVRLPRLSATFPYPKAAGRVASARPSGP